jgi:hypothetical protein
LRAKNNKKKVSFLKKKKMESNELFEYCSFFDDEIIKKHDWEFLLNSKLVGNFDVYRANFEETGLYQYYATGYFSEIKAQDFLASLLDFEVKKEKRFKKKIKIKSIENHGTHMHLKSHFWKKKEFLPQFIG